MGAGHLGHVEPDAEALRQPQRAGWDVPDHPVLVAVGGVDERDRVALRRRGTRTPRQWRRDVLAGGTVLLAGVPGPDVAVADPRPGGEPERRTRGLEPDDHLVQRVRRAAG